jgi:hypothetical protein
MGNKTNWNEVNGSVLPIFSLPLTSRTTLIGESQCANISVDARKRITSIYFKTIPSPKITPLEKCRWNDGIVLRVWIGEGG